MATSAPLTTKSDTTTGPKRPRTWGWSTKPGLLRLNSRVYSGLLSRLVRRLEALHQRLRAIRRRIAGDGSSLVAPKRAFSLMIDDPTLNQSVQKAAAILRAAAERPNGESVSGLARAVGLPRATTLRLIRTLQSEGLLLRFPSSDRVVLGVELRRLAHLVDVRDALVEAARSPLQALAVETRETVTLTIVEPDGDLSVVEQINPPSVLQLADTVGRRYPLHATSDGKLLLSTLSDERLGSILRQPLEKLTPETITDSGLLQLALDDIRRKGYGLTVDEFEVGVTSVSTGIRVCRELAGIVAVTGPTSRLDVQTRTAAANHALNAAHEIERSLATAGD